MLTLLLVSIAQNSEHEQYQLQEFEESLADPIQSEQRAQAFGETAIQRKVSSAGESLQSQGLLSADELRSARGTRQVTA